MGRRQARHLTGPSASVDRELCQLLPAYRPHCAVRPALRPACGPASQRQHRPRLSKNFNNPTKNRSPDFVLLSSARLLLCPSWSPFCPSHHLIVTTNFCPFVPGLDPIVACIAEPLHCRALALPVAKTHPRYSGILGPLHHGGAPDGPFGRCCSMRHTFADDERCRHSLSA